MICSVCGCSLVPRPSSSVEGWSGDETSVGGAWMRQVHGMGRGGNSAPTSLQKLHTHPIHVLIYTNLANMDLSWGEVW